MKQSILLLVSLMTLTNIHAQDITGQWNGVLKIQGTQLRLVFNISKSEQGYSATMDSPDQGAKNIPVTSTTFENGNLKLSIAKINMEYEGTFNNGSTVIAGTFKQGGMSFPMNLMREKIEKEKRNRPQEPTLPYPYKSEDVTFENKKAAITLAGTLTMPNPAGVYPTVVLISGSGPQNRDEELLGHKPFLVLSDYLTRNGIAVLRVDDRGTAQSKGDFKSATSQDFATDVDAAVAYLKTRKEVNQKQIGLIGHSEGGIIAPMVAANSKDIAFIVLMAGVGIPGDELLLMQQKLVGKATGISDQDLQKSEEANKKIFELVKKSTSVVELKATITSFIKQELKEHPDESMNDDMVNGQVNYIATPWMRYFISYNPALALQKTTCPVLALNGEKDLQVPAKENLEAIKNALNKGGNKKVTTKQFPNLNHLFQECKTGSPEEYSTIEQTISPEVLKEIADWIMSHKS